MHNKPSLTFDFLHYLIFLYNEGMKRFVEIVALCMLAVALLVACAEQELVFEKVQDNLGFLESADGELVLALNTEVNMTTVRSDARDVLVSEATEQIHYMHKLVDAHHAYEENNTEVVNVHYLNEHFGRGPIEVDMPLFDCIDEALTMAELTQGYFNPSIGKLAALYEDKFVEGVAVEENPTEETILQALETVVPYDKLHEHIVLDAENCTVELKPYNGKEFALTLGAIGKGYALSTVAFSLDSSYLLSAGASSIRGHLGSMEGGISWNVAVHEPDAADLLLAFELNDASVSTSGDDENYYLLEDGTRVSHILNPFTGKSENYWRNVVLVGKDAGVLDALSTALFNIEDEQLITDIVHATEDYYGFKIDYCFVQQLESEVYKLQGNEGFLARIISEYVSSKVDARMYMFENDEDLRLAE